jgi:hypothetical protein
VANGNKYGQLGNGTTDTLTTSFQATQVLTAANTPLANVAAIATAEVPTSVPHSGASCAVTTDGKLYCWGDVSNLINSGAPLSSGFAVPVTTDGTTPFTGVLQVGLFDGGYYACAIVQGTPSNGLWCWGLNGSGNLGLGDQTARPYPTKVLGINSPVKILAEGIFDPHGEDGTTCVLDGSNVRCWGQSDEGTVATGVVTDNGGVVLAPSLVTLMGTTPLDGVIDLHGGTLSSFASFCALTTSRDMLCWGYLGTQVAQTYPVTFAVANVAALGGTGGGYLRYLTDDGVYHFGTTSNHAGTTRAPNCGPLH